MAEPSLDVDAKFGIAEPSLDVDAKPGIAEPGSIGRSDDIGEEFMLGQVISISELSHYWNVF